MPQMLAVIAWRRRRKAVGAADLDHCASLDLHVQRRDQVGDNVLDGYRLGTDSNPAGA